MAIELIEYLKNHYQGILADRYQVDENEDKVKILEQIALNRNCKMKGNELDYEKASKIVLGGIRKWEIRKNFSGNTRRRDKRGIKAFEGQI